MDADEMFGPYRLESLLGRGGMGEVHLAFDTEHQRTVALKTLAPHLADDDEFQTRFRREARHVAKLRNPHVIPIHRFGEIDGRLFIDMRYVEGPDLGELVRRDGPLPPARAVAFVEQVASALDAAHADGLVHRDVKPSNVLVDATVREFVYLVDFGITRSATTQPSHSLTRTGALLGSLDYMAPEQFDGVVSLQSDVYGLACILVELLTGAKPYHGAGLAALMHSHLKTPPPAPSATDPALGAFDDVVARGMAKVAEQRFATAGELAAAARAALDGRPDGVVLVPSVVPPRTASDGVPPTAAPGEPAVSRHALAEPAPETVAVAGPPPPPDAPDASRTDPIAPWPPGGAPGPALRAERGRPGLAVVLVAAALVVLVVAGVFVATSGWTSSTRSTPAALPSSVAPEPAAPAAAEPGAVRQATYTGRTEDGLALTIVVGDSAAMAYLCDGADVEAWLRGEILPNDVVLLENSRTGAQLEAQLEPETARGQFSTPADTRSFAIGMSDGTTGLYEAAVAIDGVQNRVGWVVAADGSRTGVRTRGGEILPAPELDVAGLTTTIDGRTVPVTRHTGDGAFLVG